MRDRSITAIPAPARQQRGWPWIVSRTFDHRVSDPPRITIVTPSFNQGRFIEATLRSVLLQDYPNLEYFVMDGGSTDGAAKVIERYGPWVDGWLSEQDR